MNDMLSYLLTYKLKGEDVVRNSGIPATIIRPCALTEEPAGAPMIVAQGDDIKGKISRYRTQHAFSLLLDSLYFDCVAIMYVHGHRVTGQAPIYNLGVE